MSLIKAHLIFFIISIVFLRGVIYLARKIKDEWAPLSAGFMLTSILGFFISIWLIMDLSVTWGFTFTLFFVIMFIASLISMTKAEPVPEHMDTLAIHEPEKAYVPHNKKLVDDVDKKIKWYEPTFFLYVATWFYYIFHYFNGTIDYTNMYLAICFLAFTIFFAILFLVDIFSRESMYTWEQAIFALIIMVSAGYGAYFFPIAGIGLLIYYLHMKFF